MWIFTVVYQAWWKLVILIYSFTGVTVQDDSNKRIHLDHLSPNYSWSQIFHSQIFSFADFHSQIFFILRFSFLVYSISDFSNYTKLNKNKNLRIKISEINYSLVGGGVTFGEKLFNFLLSNFRYLVLCHPTPPALTCIFSNAIHYACDGFCGSREACMCNNGSNEAFGENLFNFLMSNFRYLVLCHPPPPPPKYCWSQIFFIPRFLFLFSLL